MHTIGMSFFILLCRSVSMVTAYHYRFTLVDLGDVGRHSDGGVLSHSEFGKALEENSLFLPAPRLLPGTTQCELPYIIVGDEAFPLRTNMLRPYPGRYLTGVLFRLDDMEVS